MKGAQEKLMREFWLRPAFHKHSMRSNGSKFHKKIAKITTPLLAFFLLLSLLFFTTRTDLTSSFARNFNLRLSSQENQNPLQYMHCNAWNKTKTCPKPVNPTKPLLKQTTTCPEYFRWIHEDLKHWKQTGITEKTVAKARRTAHFRLIIFDGKVYVEKYRPSIQTRALFTIWGIVQLMRRYPGKLPDLELMFDCDDHPVIQANKFGGPGQEVAPALFGYCSDWNSLDIVFPDWSYWGWPETNIRPWRGILEDIRKGNEKTKWEDRVPYAYWKGNPQRIPWRLDLMRCNATDQNDWNARLYVQDWRAETQKGFTESNLADQCTHRYKIYIDGYAWSVSEKYILACNSPTLLVTLRYYDFFVRGLTPQHHYWPVRDNGKCKSLKFAVEWGNNNTNKAKAIGEAGSRFIQEDLKMEYVYDYIFHLLTEYAKLLKYKPTVPPNAEELCAESMACSSGGLFRKFMEESLEMYPSDLAPCTMPQPYNPHELKAFNDQKVKSSKEVDAMEDEYWEGHNKKQ